jgi:hypothetical protein
VKHKLKGGFNFLETCGCNRKPVTINSVLNDKTIGTKIRDFEINVCCGNSPAKTECFKAVRPDKNSGKRKVMNYAKFSKKMQPRG